jgi:hypothetical protein
VRARPSGKGRLEKVRHAEVEIVEKKSKGENFRNSSCLFNDATSVA